MYEVFEHTADVGLRIEAPTLEALFEEAAVGLAHLWVLNFEDIAPREETRYEITGSQHDYLLFDWLHELLYTFESRHWVMSEFHVQITEQGLSGIARGEPVDPQRHQLQCEIKAVTYHGLTVEPTAQGWRAEVIFDI